MKLGNRLSLVLLALSLAAGPVWSQAYPSRPIKMVVGFPAGGSTDIIARLIAKKISETLGQPVVVDNKPGAASNIAAQEVARAPADGYTLLYMTSTLAVNEALYPKLPFNLANDFAPVTPVVDSPCVLSIHPSVAARNLKEFVALAKTTPGTITYASAGSGSASHLATELFKTMAGVDLLHVPYKGGGQALTDFLGGHVKVLINCQISTVKEPARTGRLFPLAVTSRQRLSNMPELPTMSEAGITGYEATVWNGILAPVGTPRDVIAKINASVAQAVKESTLALIEIGAYPMYSSPDNFNEFVKTEIGRWATIVKRSGARAE
jgi:tripartite-type tricarboxylate transporter receptor subunit TctC